MSRFPLNERSATMGDSIYVVFEHLPQRWGSRLPEPKNPVWDIAVYKVVGETGKRLILEPIGGETRSLPRDAQGRKYFARDEYLRLCDHGSAWRSTDLDAVLAYREQVLAMWATSCAERDGVARPLFAEI